MRTMSMSDKLSEAILEIAEELGGIELSAQTVTDLAQRRVGYYSEYKRMTFKGLGHDTKLDYWGQMITHEQQIAIMEARNEILASSAYEPAGRNSYKIVSGRYTQIVRELGAPFDYESKALLCSVLVDPLFRSQRYQVLKSEGNRA